LWRVSQPVIQTPGRLVQLPRKYVQFFRKRKQFMAMDGDAPFGELHPTLFDETPATQSGGSHYFYQDIWALRKLAELKPEVHCDVGSRLDGFVGQATAICPVICYDIRPPCFQLPHLEFRLGSILDLPAPDNSIRSLSCLHVAEHIGLGRYGDEIDPKGTEKALKELMRVVAPGGQLLFSVPVGFERVCFNAERIWHPEKPLEVLNELRLVEFKAVSDSGEFLENVQPGDLTNADYSCGLYCFSKD
jgi:SAM-dependent methyltransferase